MERHDSQIIIALHRIIRDLDKRTRALCLKKGLTLAQFAALEALYHKGRMSIGDLKKKVLSTDGTIPVIVKNLEKNGFIRRETDASDKRKCFLLLTKKGTSLIREILPENTVMIARQFSLWSREEKEQLVLLLRRYTAP